MINDIAISKSFLHNKDIPRGMRLNNPLLIKKSNIEWPGKIKENKDRSFESFEFYWQGVHAGLRILQKYYFDDRARTIEKIIFKFSRPGTELTPYIQAVSIGTGIRTRQVFPFTRPTMYLIINEMARYENRGRNPEIHPDLFAYTWTKI